MNKPLLYLASESPRRREILRRMGISFRVIPSAYRELPLRGLGPSQHVMTHAIGKVCEALPPRKDRPILGADTIVYCRRKIFGKPASKKAAFRMIRALSGRVHFVYTGVALYDPVRKRIHSGYAKTQVFFKKLTDRQIRKYLVRVNPLDKAGAYAVQERSRVVRIVKGSYTNVVGLPEELVRKLLRDEIRKKR